MKWVIIIGGIVLVVVIALLFLAFRFRDQTAGTPDG